MRMLSIDVADQIALKKDNINLKEAQIYIQFYTVLLLKMRNSQTVPQLPPLKRELDDSDHSLASSILMVRNDNTYSRPKMHRIIYPPLPNRKTKQNHRRLLMQSYIEKKTYEDIWDEANEKKIRRQLGPSQQGSRKNLQPASACTGKEATFRYYNDYKILDKMLSKQDYTNSSALSSPESTPRDTIQLNSPSISLLEKADILKVLPLCLGLVKEKGEANILNISNYNLGDRYIIALSAGLRNSKMIQKCYMSANRITDVGLSQLVHSLSSQVTVLDLSLNKITKVDKKLLQMIIEPQYRLQQLNLSSNLLREQSAQAIFRNVGYSHRLKRLNVSNNRLTVNSLEALTQMIEKSTGLEQLYIGSNYFSGKAGERIFQLLTNNKTIKVLDYSLNQLGEDCDLSCCKAIALCLKTNKTLEHVDLSFNNIGKQATQIIAEGLQSNKHIYGLHFRGNYGYVNSRGFLILEEKEVTLLPSVQKQRMDGYEITSNRERNAYRSQVYKNVCWICQGWYEHQFKLCLSPSSSKILVYIHFDFEKYEPRLIALNQHQVRYTTMVPPKKYRYFFTVNTELYLDKQLPLENIPLVEVHSYEMEHAIREFKVEHVHFGEGKPKKIANQWNQITVKTVPRINGLMTKKQKIPWKFQRSVWAKEWKLQDEQLLRKCFQRDWKHSKLMNLIKNQSDQDQVKLILWKYYPTIKNMYKQFSSWSPFGDVWAVSNQPFTEFCQITKIINKDTPLKIIDLTFITTNSMSSADWKGNSLNPERGLVRFQFMQSLVRLSQQKFKKNGLCDTFSQSVSMLLKDHVQPLGNQYNSNQWRLQKYFVEFNDTLIKKYRPIFTAIYKRNSKLKLKPGEKPFMCLAEFKSIVQRAGLSNYITERDTLVSFNTAMMTQVDELESQRFTKMTEIQFIEGMARCASVLPNQCSIGSDNVLTPLHRKFQWMIHQLKTALCREDIRAQFPDPQISIFDEEEQ